MYEAHQQLRHLIFWTNCGSPSNANLNIPYYAAYSTPQCSISVLYYHWVATREGSTVRLVLSYLKSYDDVCQTYNEFQLARYNPHRTSSVACEAYSYPQI